MKTYREIDLKEQLIVVLGCGHFFTAESLDGIMEMSEVNEMDGYGDFIGLKDISGALASAMPSYPDCKCPVKHYVTQRYNRVINRAVIDEMSKRFLDTGKEELRTLEEQIIDLEKKLDTFRDMLHEATVHGARKTTAAGPESLEDHLANLTIAHTIPRERCITRGRLKAQIHTECVILNDKFIITQATSSQASVKIPYSAPSLLALPFFEKCHNFITERNAENLPKLAVEASLFYARITRPYESFCHSAKMKTDRVLEIRKTTEQFLDSAREACKLGFENSKNLGVVVNYSKNFPQLAVSTDKSFVRIFSQKDVKDVAVVIYKVVTRQPNSVLTQLRISTAAKESVP